VSRTIDIDQLQAELAESRRRYNSLMENCVDGIIVIDEHGVILEFNKSAERIFGYRATDVVGRNVSILMPEPDRSRHDGYIENYLKTGAGQIIGVGREVTGKRKDGQEFPMDLSVGEMPDGGTRQFVGIVRDITARRNVAMQLRQASKMEAIGQLTGGIAHDFNNLLAILKMDLEILESLCDENEEGHELVREALEVTGTAADLTQRLLAFSRRQPLSPSRVDIQSLIASLSTLLRRTLGEAIRIDTGFAADLPEITVDASQLESAILNLAVNARDAMEEGGRLTINVAPTLIRAGDVNVLSEDDLPADGEYVSICVSDTGAGIPAENLERVFEPFFTTKEGGHGTGLGLSMVYGFVRQSGGGIRIDSNPGKGTRICLLFPVAGEAQPATNRTENAVPGLARHLNVLLAEDHEPLRNRTGQVLRAMGHQVAEAQNGEEAVAALEGADPAFDLVLSDIVMPGKIDGMQLADLALAAENPPKVILMTGYSQKLDEMPPSPSVKLLAKPFSRDALAAAVAELFAG